MARHGAYSVTLSNRKGKMTERFVYETMQTLLQEAEVTEKGRIVLGFLSAYTIRLVFTVSPCILIH